MLNVAFAAAVAVSAVMAPPAMAPDAAPAVSIGTPAAKPLANGTNLNAAASRDAAVRPLARAGDPPVDRSELAGWKARMVRPCVRSGQRVVC